MKLITLPSLLYFSRGKLVKAKLMDKGLTQFLDDQIRGTRFIDNRSLAGAHSPHMKSSFSIFDITAVHYGNN